MKVEPISNGNLRVWLTAQEMPSAGDRCAWRLLRRLLQTVGRPLARQGKRLVAELIPVAGGGLLLLSAERCENGVFVYRIDTLEALYRLAEGWMDLAHTVSHPRPQTVLYERGTSYDLVVCPFGSLSREELSLLRTHATLRGRGAVEAARCAEYGRPLASGDALGALIGREPIPPAPSDPAR